MKPNETAPPARSNGSRPRVVIVDRLPTVADVLRAALDRTGVADVVGVFTDGSRSTIRAISGLHADAIVVEMKTGGPGLVQQLRRGSPKARLVVTTSAHDSVEERAAKDAGADAYLQKDPQVGTALASVLRA